jgi:hypothetical protein
MKQFWAWENRVFYLCFRVMAFGLDLDICIGRHAGYAKFCTSSGMFADGLENVALQMVFNTFASD